MEVVCYEPIGSVVPILSEGRDNAGTEGGRLLREAPGWMGIVEILRDVFRRTGGRGRVLPDRASQPPQRVGSALVIRRGPFTVRQSVVTVDLVELILGDDAR